MAEAILRSFDNSLEIYSGAIKPADHISPVAIEVLAEYGIELKPHEPQIYSNFIEHEFDYLITVGDGTNEELEIPPLNFKRKMHLGLHNPYKRYKSRDELVFKCREICEEILIELDYFYRHMLFPKTKEGS